MLQLPSTDKLRQIAKKGKDEIMSFVFQCVMSNMNESQLLILEENVAGLNQEDPNQSDLMNALLTKIVLRRRHMYIFYLKYKIEKQEDIQMTESEYHKALLNEEKARKDRGSFQKILEALRFRKPQLLRDQAIPDYLINQEELIKDLQQRNRAFHMNNSFTAQFSHKEEVRKLKEKYMLTEKESTSNHDLLSCQEDLETEGNIKLLEKPDKRSRFQNRLL